MTRRPQETVGSAQKRTGPATAVLAWYDVHARDLPWRRPPDPTGRAPAPDPYRVWLSEIMLQQTTVAAVTAYFKAFTERWPTIETLAAADETDITAAWAGLGYYSRARNLHACARMVADEHGGRFPESAEELKRPPPSRRSHSTSRRRSSTAISSASSRGSFGSATRCPAPNRSSAPRSPN